MTRAIDEGPIVHTDSIRSPSASDGADGEGGAAEPMEEEEYCYSSRQREPSPDTSSSADEENSCLRSSYADIVVRGHPGSSGALKRLSLLLTPECGYAIRHTTHLGVSTATPKEGILSAAGLPSHTHSNITQLPKTGIYLVTLSQKQVHIKS